MKNDAKSPTPHPGDHLTGLKRAAVDHFKRGDHARTFAEAHGLARTTVIGWEKRWKADRVVTKMGRPRSLQFFNELRVIEAIRSRPDFHDWRSVQQLIREQSGDELSRRAVLRYLTRWGFSQTFTVRAKKLLLVGEQWVQPAATVQKAANALNAKIWRLVSGRGMEAFMLTTSASFDTSRKVADALIGKVKGRRRRLVTNDADLAALLKVSMPTWEIEMFDSPSCL